VVSGGDQLARQLVMCLLQMRGMLAQNGALGPKGGRFLLHSSEFGLAVGRTTLCFLGKHLSLPLLRFEVGNMVTQARSIGFQRHRVMAKSLSIRIDLFEPLGCIHSNSLVGPAENEPGLVHLPAHLVEYNQPCGCFRRVPAPQLIERIAGLHDPTVDWRPSVNVARVGYVMAQVRFHELCDGLARSVGAAGPRDVQIVRDSAGDSAPVRQELAIADD
jgi:hypothetical protein